MGSGWTQRVRLASNRREKTARATTTLGDLHRATPWLWLNCEHCQHHAPLACAVAVIRWGAGASSDLLRERARCTRCGHKGATIQHPGWGGADIGFLPFPDGRSPTSASSTSAASLHPFFFGCSRLGAAVDGGIFDVTGR
jgi:hypothetical protein